MYHCNWKRQQHSSKGTAVSQRWLCGDDCTSWDEYCLIRKLLL